MDFSNTTWQRLMDKAFDSFGNKTFKEFAASLPIVQRQAVVLGTLNYQVENGGFRQWVDNGYALAGHEVQPTVDAILNELMMVTDRERDQLMRLSRNVERLLEHVNTSAKDRGFCHNYWEGREKDEWGNYGQEDTAGELLADSFDSWYYGPFTEIAIPAIVRYFDRVGERQ